MACQDAQRKDGFKDLTAELVVYMEPDGHHERLLVLNPGGNFVANVVRGIKKRWVGQSQVSDNTRPIGEKGVPQATRRGIC